MTNKVQLTKEQCDAMDEITRGQIAAYEDSREFNSFAINEHFTAGEWLSDEFPGVLTISTSDFIAALHYGYEVKRTKYDDVRVYFEYVLNQHEGTTSGLQRSLLNGTMDGIEKTLDVLGISVKDVNAEEDSGIC